MKNKEKEFPNKSKKSLKGNNYQLQIKRSKIL